MKALSIVIFRVLAIYLGVLALRSSANVPAEVYFQVLEGWPEVDWWLWMLSDLLAPSIAAFTLWFGSNYFANKLCPTEFEPITTDDKKIVAVGVFLLGLWLIFSGLPFIISSLWDIYSNQFPAFEGMHTRNATIGLLQVIIGMLFVLHPGALVGFYGKRISKSRIA